jgi:hypothetical protein
MLSHAMDSETALPGWTWRHISACSSCRRHFASRSSLHERLRADAPEIGAPLSPLFSERAWAAVQAEKSKARAFEKKTRPGSSRLGWVAAAASCLVLILAFYICYPDNPERASNSFEKIAAMKDSFAELGSRLPQLELPVQDGVPWQECLAKPLNTEVERLAKDAESVKNFILAFLPRVTALQMRLR